MSQSLNLPTNQQGASVFGVMFAVIAIVVFVKLGIAIVPAQISDYQLTKSMEVELKKANDNKETAKQFMQNVQRQLKIDGVYGTEVDEIVKFTNDAPGSLAVHKEYEVKNNLFGNVFIVNRFEGEIDPTKGTE